MLRKKCFFPVILSALSFSSGAIAASGDVSFYNDNPVIGSYDSIQYRIDGLAEYGASIYVSVNADLNRNYTTVNLAKTVSPIVIGKLHYDVYIKDAATNSDFKKCASGIYDSAASHYNFGLPTKIVGYNDGKMFNCTFR